MDASSQTSETFFSNENLQMDPNRVSVDRITLKSRTLIPQMQSEQHEHHEMSSAIDVFEATMLEGLSTLRNTALNVSQAEKQSAQRIAAMQASIDMSKEKETEHLETIRQLQSQIEQLQGALETSEKRKTSVEQKFIHLQSQQNSHLESIARETRKKQVSRKYLSRWKSKALHSAKFPDLQYENEQLKLEIIKWQKDAKQAFLRSARALNKEALGVFEQAATRHLIPHSELSINSHSCSSTDVSRRSDSEYDIGRHRSHRRPRKALRSNRKSQSEDFINSEKHSFDVLRQETRHLLRNLKKTKETTPDVSQCHCRREILCQYCSSRANEANFNSVLSKNQPKKSVRSGRNVAVASFIANDAKSKVFYNPTSSAVIIEKHAKSS